MAASLNKVLLIGNLTADPELKYTSSGTARTKFRIAINRQYKDSSGQLQEETAFVPIVAWGTQAENCANYLNKGRSVAVEGRLRIYNFTDEEGQEVRWFEIVAQNVQFLGSPPRSASEPGTVPPSSDQPAQGAKDDEEVPF
ncbi:single-stranded DNA-binding protein [Candidatus Bipolaricaulota bacterium]|nr:single-stranded DNA-binding protein [Candidatus Bipolaricaulota bacterium]MCK4598517.1 single-stranded DNA-binding protein [Candidatus Bipolaricaulota bacterium]